MTGGSRSISSAAGPHPKSFDGRLDEEYERIRAERGRSSVERALVPRFQDLAARLRKAPAR